MQKYIILKAVRTALPMIAGAAATFVALNYPDVYTAFCTAPVQ